MDPNTLILLVAVLGCPIGMGLMMWMMNKKMGGQHDHTMPGDQQPTNSEERLAALHTQRRALEAEIAETTRLAELEIERDALRDGRTAISQNRAD